MVENKGSFFDNMTDEANEQRQPLMMNATAPTEEEEQDDIIFAATEATPILHGNNDNDAAPNHVENQKVGAGVAAGVVGLLLGGPFIGVLLGFGSAYATGRDGATGDAARALGDVALLASAKAKEVDDKHNLMEKSKVAANEAWEKAKELDRRHHVLERTTEFVVWSWESIKEINRRHRLLERSIEAVGRAMAHVAKKISEKLNPQGGDHMHHGDDAIPDMSLVGGRSTTQANATFEPMDTKF